LNTFATQQQTKQNDSIDVFTTVHQTSNRHIHAVMTIDVRESILLGGRTKFPEKKVALKIAFLV